MNKKTLSASWMRQGIVLLVMAGLLQGCGGGGHHGAAAPVVITDPTGYYDNTGTMSLTATNPPVAINDLQGMITSTRFIMASKAQGYYYDVPITMSGNAITGNLVQQFQIPGITTDTATLSATINSDHSISGKLVYDSDGHTDSFTLHYATGRANSKVADVVNSLANQTWTGTTYNKTSASDTLTVHFTDNGAGAAVIATDTLITDFSSGFINCVFAGTLTPIAGTSLYEVSLTTTNCTNPGSLNALNAPFTGLAAIRPQTNTLVIAAYMKKTLTSAIFGEFQ